MRHGTLAFSMRFALLPVLCIGCVSVGRADGPLEIRQPRPAPPEGKPLRATTEMVMINATVVDRNGRMITTLAPQQIRLFEEGVPQQVRSFSLEQAPVSLALVLDWSGSMKRPYPHVREALARFSAGLAPGDEYMVVAFRDRPQVRIPFSRDSAPLEQLMAQEQPDGSTALIDALVLALEEVRSGRNPRKAILVLSDGVERSSRYTWKDLRSIVRESTAPIYVFLLPGFEREATDDFELWRIVEESGGRVVQVGKPGRFPDALDRLEIHQQYVIGYTPTNRTRDGGFRRVKIELAGTGGKMRVFWRRGYYAPNGSPPSDVTPAVLVHRNR